jgi:hypothetical protein
MWKLHISTKTDKGFRLVYELSYQVEKKISTFFSKWSLQIDKKGQKIFLT